MPGNDSYTKLLLHFDGPNGSQTFPDVSGSNHTINVVGGGLTVDTSNSVFGGASLNAGSGHLYTADSSDFDFGTGDFTIDMWIFNPTFQNDVAILTKSTGNYQGWILVKPSDNHLYFLRGNGTSWGTYAISDITLPTNQWVHIAIVQSSGVIYYYINGVQHGSYIPDGGINGSATSLYIGEWQNIPSYSGKVACDELRISKGIARWSGNFTPPTHEYDSRDIRSLDSYTKLLIDANGTDGSQYFQDESDSAHSITSAGTAQNDTAQSKFGGASCLLDGNSDYLQIANGTDFQFGSGDFTIDTWVRFNTLGSGTYNFLAFAVGSDNWQFGLNAATNEFFVWGDASVFLISSAQSLSTGVWYHVAYVRYGNLWKIYLNGNEIASATKSYTLGLPNHGNQVLIGAEVTAPSQFLNGWLDEFRVSKGIARWTNNFTPPSDEYGYVGTNDLTIDETLTLLENYFESADLSINESITLSDLKTMELSGDLLCLLLHGNDSDGATIFFDSSAHAHGNGTATGSVQIDTAQSKFGGSSIYFPSSYPHYISYADSPDWDFLNNDFTIDCWVRFNSFFSHPTIMSRSSVGGTYFYIALNGNGSVRFRDYGASPDIDTNFTFDSGLNTNQWYHLAFTKEGTNLRCFLNGIQQGSIYTINGSFMNRTTPLQIGTLGGDIGYQMDGWIDELRIINGIAEWTANFTPPTSEYSGTPEAVINESLSLSDDWDLTQNPNPLDILESITLIDEWTLDTNPNQIDFNEIISLSDQWSVETNPQQSDLNDTVTLSEIFSLSRKGTIHEKFQTRLPTSIDKLKNYMTSLRVKFLKISKYTTRLSLQYLNSKKYSTSLRVSYFDYASITTGSLDDFIVKLDGVNLTDVDYNTLNITLNLNTSPSQATFTLARRHDNLDKKLDGTTSVITNENKVEVFDGTRKLFTGYISEIDADSTTDTVRITADDIRRKLSAQSMELAYGGDWQRDSNSNGIPDVDDPDATVDDNFKYIRFEKNIETALNEVFDTIGGQISGHDNLPFDGSYVPEYVKSDNDYVSLIDTLVRQTANCNWYVDENERVRFQPISQGTVKELALASLNSKRHIYDLVINDVHLNKTPIEYAKSYVVKCGKAITKTFYRHDFTGWLDGLADLLAGLTDKTSFCFQRWGTGNWFYVGINQTIYGYATASGWVLEMGVTVQWSPASSLKRANINCPDIVVGSGLPQKTIYMESYGTKRCDTEWAEETRDEGGEQVPWLVTKTDEQYNRIPYLTDLANFELSQNNKKITTANVSMILDAYEYYNISFKDLINLTNTIQPDIYKNNNGFPLNIAGIQIDCSRRTVSLSLSNFGKSWFVKTANYLSTWVAPKHNWEMRKELVQQFSMNP